MKDKFTFDEDIAMDKVSSIVDSMEEDEYLAQWKEFPGVDKPSTPNLKDDWRNLPLAMLLEKEEEAESRKLFNGGKSFKTSKESQLHSMLEDSSQMSPSTVTKVKK